MKNKFVPNHGTSKANETSALCLRFAVDLKKENMERHAELKDAVRDMGYGFIEMRGGYKEEDGGFVNELSLFIPNISKRDIMDLGFVHDQDS